MTGEVKNQRPEPKEKASVIRKRRLAELMAEREIKDLRFMYFMAGKYYVTAVTLLNREESALIIAFSFCSPKDSFCKREGKIKCLERIQAYEKLARGEPRKEGEAEAKYIITMPFANTPSLVSIGIAYNLLPLKPEKITESKFNFDIVGCVVTK